MNKLNENLNPHGPWEYYWSNDQLYYRGEYRNGKSHGLWEHYWSNGHTVFLGEFKEGNEIGLWYEDKYDD